MAEIALTHFVRLCNMTTGCHAQALAQLPALYTTTFLGVSSNAAECKAAMQANSQPNIVFECLEERHFFPEVGHATCEGASA